MSDAKFWKRKLAAYLHDPPSKALDIKNHGERSDAAFRSAGFIDAEVGDYFEQADHTGASADRLPFPASQASGLRCAFDGIRNAFLHPLDGTNKLPFHAEFKSAEQGIEGEASVQPVLTAESLAGLPSESDRWRARYFAHWRLWPQHAAEKDYRLVWLPADTRIPDHTIWTHMQVVSALDGCIGEDKVWRPAFLKFQLGPVQDFIAAARSIRDLWSGSYLLSWLMAAGMKALSAEIGPDAVIYPNLRGQPLFDLHWREDLWNKVNIGTRPVWESFKPDNREFKPDESDLLTPNLPNVFLAVVPADRANELAKKVKDAIVAEWKVIAGAVWIACEKAGLTGVEGGITAGKRKARFESQIARFLSLSWQATPWPATLEDALKLAAGFGSGMPIQQARERVQKVVDMAEQHMSKDHRDVRYFECERFSQGHPRAGWKDRSKLKDDAKLDNIGLGWAVILAFNSWSLDAVRQTRHFAAANSGGWETGTFNNKDVLSGRDEAVAGGSVWTERAGDYFKSQGGPWKSLFKHDDWLSAATLVKRLWHFAYLAEKPWSLETGSKPFPMPNTRSLAAHDPFSRDDDPENDEAQDTDSSEKYFAVLALDGDKIGEWISGEKTPPFESQLADYKDGSNVQRFGAKQYFERAEFKEFLNAQRPLSPSYHLQFSEALSNFALWCARPIVETFDGRLIYAGGDDVVALLPADTALACAQALRMAFTGSPKLKETLQWSAVDLRQRHENERAANSKAAPAPECQKLAAEGRLLAVAETAKDGRTIIHPGFLARLDDAQKPPDQRHFADGTGRPIPFLVPGPAAACSVGIAIAHFKAPLQDVVRAAQAAEKRAKKDLGRSAVAVTLMKRSGEILEWGCQWNSGGLEFIEAVQVALAAEALSAKFPHRVVELLEPYRTQPTGLAQMTDDAGFSGSVKEIIEQEVATALKRQRGSNWDESLPALMREKLSTYLKNLADPQSKIQAIIGLMQTAAFAHRTRTASDENSQPKRIA
jgi:CRISPR-associated protein Cmr2